MKFSKLSRADQEDLARKRVRDAEIWGQEDRRESAEVLLGERCYLARRAAGIDLKAAAVLMGISHVALIKRERNNGRVHETAEHWGLA